RAGMVFNSPANLPQEKAQRVLGTEYAAIEATILKDVTTLFAETQRTAAQASARLAQAHATLQFTVLSAVVASIVIGLLIGVMLVRNVTSRPGPVAPCDQQDAAWGLGRDT